MTATLPARLAAVVEEFAELEPRERLETLLDYCDNLPPLPPEYEAQKQAGLERVHECMTPVFLWTTVVDGRVQIVADVAPEAPTVKGFVGLLVDTLNGAKPEEVAALDPLLLSRLGLVEALGMQRMRGLGAIVQRIRTAAAQAT